MIVAIAFYWEDLMQILRAIKEHNLKNQIPIDLKSKEDLETF